MKINLIIAFDKNGVMGKGDKLPWKLSDDLKHFKSVTNNSPLIMGSKTFNSLPGILPNREHLVLSNTMFSDANKSVFTSIKEVLEYCEDAKFDNVFVIGGVNLVNQFCELNLFDELIITHVESESDGDIILDMDVLKLETFHISNIQKIEKSEKNEHSFTIVNYIKITKRFY